MEYETIELEIGVGSGREYPVTVRSPAGEGHGIMRFPFDELALENRLMNLQNALLRSGGQRRQFFSGEQETVQKFGQDLFNALMTNEIRLCYEKSEDRAQLEGKGLRVQLRIQPPEIATLPWEFMYDADRATYLALSPRTPVIRYLALPRSIDPLTVEPPLRILGMIASPQGVQSLDIQREKERLERAVGSLQQRGLLELTWVQGETWRDLQQALRNSRWHIFHFVGHGGFDALTDEGFIVLSDKQQQPHLLPATQLAELLTGYYPPRLVILNACDGAQSSKRDIFSSTASILLRHGIPAVVAMQYEITDRAAIEFSSSFYEAVATGLSIETAIAEARKAIWISISNSFEWGTPVLYTHAPDGVLFNIQPRTPQAANIASQRKPETPQQSANRLPEQESQRIETQNKVQQSLSEKVVTTKPERVEEGHDRAERTQVSPSRPSQSPSDMSASSEVSPNRESVRKRSNRWIWALGAIVLLFVGISMFYVFVPPFTGNINKSGQTPIQGVSLAYTSTPSAMPTYSSTSVLTATPVPSTASGLPMHTSLPPTTIPFPTDTPTPNLTTTAQAEVTIQSANDMTLTALAPTMMLTLSPSPTSTPVPATATSFPTNTPSATPTPTDTARPIDLIDANDGVYVWIPAGQFAMGSGAKDKLAQDDEKPPSPVNMKEFLMMQKEVTNAQYARCVTAGVCEKPANDRWNDAHYAEHPVVDVNWYQASKYAAWVGGRLPTEAEWEYACRGTDGRIYPWGNQVPNPQLLNFNKGDTMPVGSYPPGANGLYDMAGNVWEWTSSLYQIYPYKADDGREDPKALGKRTLRGGSFVEFDYLVRCAARGYSYPNYGNDNVGFRVVYNPLRD